VSWPTVTRSRRLAHESRAPRPCLDPSRTENPGGTRVGRRNHDLSVPGSNPGWPIRRKRRWSAIYRPSTRAPAATARGWVNARVNPRPHCGRPHS
jgi:hypothetical protein